MGPNTKTIPGGPIRPPDDPPGRPPPDDDD